jgi:hypothetical protein
LSKRQKLIVFLCVLVGVLVISGAATALATVLNGMADRQEASDSAPRSVQTPAPSPPAPSSPAPTPSVDPIFEVAPPETPASPVSPTIEPDPVETAMPEPPAVISEPTKPVVNAPAPATPDVQCPTGVVRAGVTRVEFGVPDYKGATSIGITAHGSVRNDSSAAITFSDGDVPNLEGLDSRGSTTFFELYGEYSYVPPVGQPRRSELTLEPGQSMTYQVIKEYAPTDILAATKFWHNDLDSHSFPVYFLDAPTECDLPRVIANAAGQSVPNLYKPSA